MHIGIRSVNYGTSLAVEAAVIVTLSPRNNRWYFSGAWDLRPVDISAHRTVHTSSSWLRCSLKLAVYTN